MYADTSRKLVAIPADHVELEGMLEMTEQPSGIVLFAHGSGSSRHSPRNNYVAGILQKASIATLLFDLLTDWEDINYATRFNISLLTERLLAATAWVEKYYSVQNLKTGYFGASTGAAAALQAAAEMGKSVAAVVSRGGRPDLAGEESLKRVLSPTLLLVGGLDHDVLALNKTAFASMSCRRELVTIRGASHLFEEPGTLEQVADLAAAWFKKYFAPNSD